MQDIDFRRSAPYLQPLDSRATPPLQYSGLLSAGRALLPFKRAHRFSDLTVERLKWGASTPIRKGGSRSHVVHVGAVARTQTHRSALKPRLTVVAPCLSRAGCGWEAARTRYGRGRGHGRVTLDIQEHLGSCEQFSGQRGVRVDGSDVLERLVLYDGLWR